jgi:hypothetical protein
LHLAPQHSHLTGITVISRDELDIEMERVGDQFGFGIGRAAYSRGGQLDRLLGVLQIQKALVRTFGGYNQSARFRGGLAEITHVGQIKMNTLAFQDLRVDQSGIKRPDRQSVRISVVNLVGTDDMTRPRNVLDDDTRTS